MSLNRVTGVETLADQHDHRGSDSHSGLRKLSFNPVPQDWDSPQPSPSLHGHKIREDPHISVGAFEVPRWKRITQVATAVVYCLFAAGVVFGYAALKPVLIDEGAYEAYCASNEDGSGVDDTCVEIHLNLMFTVAAVGTNVAALPVGAILDAYGPRLCGIIGSLLLFSGALLLAYAQVLPFDGLLLGYLLLALGGPFTFISSFQLSNAFPRHSGLILALLTGAFDSSSAVFLIYRLIYDATEGGFNHRHFFQLYLIVPVAILIMQLTIMPAQSYTTIGELVDDAHNIETVLQATSMEPEPYFDDQTNEETSLLRGEHRKQRQQQCEQGEAFMADIESVLGSAHGERIIEAEERKNNKSGVWGVLHDKNVWEQIRSPWYILICLFTVVQMTRINYFVATIRVQYKALFGNLEQAIAVNNFFDVALPVGGIVSIPLVGLILDRTSTIVVLTSLVSIATLIGILGVLPYMWAAYANVILFVLYRPFYYTAVSDYSAKVFGFRSFGTVYGLIICLSGLLNFSQSGLDILFHKTFKEDPVPVNLILLMLGFLIGISLIGFVSLQISKLRVRASA